MPLTTTDKIVVGAVAVVVALAVPITLAAVFAPVFCILWNVGIAPVVTIAEPIESYWTAACLLFFVLFFVGRPARASKED